MNDNQSTNKKKEKIISFKKINRVNPITLIRNRLTFKNGKCVNALQVASSVDILKLAYESIKSNPGNMSLGSDNETLDGITDQ